MIPARFATPGAKACLLLAAICLAGYWPISLNLFALKNDAVMYFLPYRYQISNAIRHHEFPFWSPYLYLGFPLHADMQSGAWNPIVWLISLFTSYNMTVLQAESSLYIFLAGVGMYRLLTQCKVEHRVAVTTAVCYMFCGFITDTGQFIVWLASAAFVPLVVLYYYRLLYTPSFAGAFKSAIAMFFLLVAGYPSFVIFLSYLLLAALAVRVTGLTRKRQWAAVRRLVVMQALFALLFLVFSLPALISYLEFLPYYKRGAGVSLNAAQTHPFTLKAASSFLTPFNLSREQTEFGSDPTMRNTYAGIFAIMFCLFALTKPLRGIAAFALGVLVASFLFSLGGATPVHALAFRILPLMNYFRHPANMRLFTIIALLVVAATGMQRFVSTASRQATKTMLLLCLVTALAVIAVIVFFASSPANHATGAPPFSMEIFRSRLRLKQWLYDISLPSAVLIVGIMQIIFLAVGAYLIRHRRLRALLALMMMNAVVIAQLSLPSTFVTLTKPAAINSFIREFPTGFPLASVMKPVARETAENESFHPRAFGYASYYAKSLSLPAAITSPCVFTSFEQLLADPAAYSPIIGNPPFYLGHHDSGSKVQLRRFGANGFDLLVSTSLADTLHVTQTMYKYWKATVDGRPVPIQRDRIALMSVAVAPGVHQVQFRYSPLRIWISMIIAAIAFVLVSAYWLFLRRDNRTTDQQTATP